MRVFFVRDILVVDQAPGNPKLAVLRLIDLVVRVIALRVPLFVGTAGFFPDAVLVGEFQQQRVAHGGPDVALRVRMQRADVPGNVLLSVPSFVILSGASFVILSVA